MVSLLQRCWNTRLKANTLKQAPSNVRASHSAMRGWSREFAETLRRYDGTSGSSAHQTVSTGPVPTDVDQTRTMSGFSSGKDGKGKSKGNCKSKDGKGKGKGKKGDNLSNSKDTAGTARSGDTRVTTAGNASPTARRKVVRQLPLLTMMETSQP